jgi:hypothetical protein
MVVGGEVEVPMQGGSEVEVGYAKHAWSSGISCWAQVSFLDLEMQHETPNLDLY